MRINNQAVIKFVCAASVCAAALSLTALAQGYTLTRGLNMPRGGDKVAGCRVEPFSAVETGADVLWDFSGLDTGQETGSVRYSVSGDTLLVRSEGAEQAFYRMSGDTLSLVCLSAPGKLVIYPRPEQVVRFPMSHLESSGGYFTASGRIDGDVCLSQAGYSNTGISAWGRLITPDGDSLRNVLLAKYIRHGTTEMSRSGNPDRVIPCIDSINLRLATDSVTHRMETLKWFARGLRYPVVEVNTIKTYHYGAAVDSVVVATYNSPRSQRESLASDPANDSLYLADMQKPFGPSPFSLSRGAGSTPDGGGLEDGMGLRGNSCNLYPTIVDAVTTIRYLALEECQLVATVFSPSGSQTCRYAAAIPAGEGEMALDLSALARNAYVVTVTLGNDKFDFKIFKE